MHIMVITSHQTIMMSDHTVPVTYIHLKNLLGDICGYCQHINANNQLSDGYQPVHSM
jgi:hypothetical protein